nr:ribonuclease H-like domain-containing protein [Tanacetum cinerariifolium]
LFAPPTNYLSNSGLEEFQHLESKGYGPKASKIVCVDTSNEIKKAPYVLIIEDWVSDSDKDDSEVMVLKYDNGQHKPEQANQPRKVSQNPRNNETNWNEMRTQKLGVGFQFTKKACFMCGSFSHLIKDYDFHDKKDGVKGPTVMTRQRPRNQDSSRKTVNVEDTSSKAMVAIDRAGFDWSNMADDEAPTNMALMAFSDSEEFQHLESKGYGPKASKIVCVDTSNEIKKAPYAPIIEDWVSDSDKDDSEMVQKPVLKNMENGTGQKEVRPVWNNTMRINHQNLFNSKRNFAPTAVLTKSEIVPISTARQSSSRATTPGDPQDALKDQRYFDSGYSRHITRNISYLTDFKEHDGGYVAFWGEAKGGKITGKGTIRTGKGASFDAGQSSLETGPSQDYILMPLWKDNSLFDSYLQDSNGHNKDKHGPSQESKCDNQGRPNAESSTKNINTAGPNINTTNANDNTGSLNINTVSPPVNTATPTYADYHSDPLMLDLVDTGIFNDAYDDRDEGAEADYNNLETMEPKKVTQALDDESWVEAMQEELLQFKLLNVWTLLDLPHGKRAIGTKWVFRNKRDQRGIVVRNKARLVA